MFFVFLAVFKQNKVILIKQDADQVFPAALEVFTSYS